MANRNAAYKDVMNELRGKIKEHSASKFRKEESSEEESEESAEHEESEDEDEGEGENTDDMPEEVPEGPDLCSSCDSKMDAKHKFCANCGTKR
jgi:hypothetical protein